MGKMTPRKTPITPVSLGTYRGNVTGPTENLRQNIGDTLSRARAWRRPGHPLPDFFTAFCRLSTRFDSFCMI